MRFKGALEGSIGQSNPEGPGGSQGRFSGPQEISGGLSGVSGGSKEFQEVSEGRLWGFHRDPGGLRTLQKRFRGISTGLQWFQEACEELA